MKAVVVSQELCPFNHQIIVLKLKPEFEVTGGVTIKAEMTYVVPASEAREYIAGSEVIVSIWPSTKWTTTGYSSDRCPKCGSVSAEDPVGGRWCVNRLCGHVWSPAQEKEKSL